MPKSPNWAYNTFCFLFHPRTSGISPDFLYIPDFQDKCTDTFSGLFPDFRVTISDNDINRSCYFFFQAWGSSWCSCWTPSRCWATSSSCASSSSLSSASSASNCGQDSSDSDATFQRSSSKRSSTANISSKKTKKNLFLRTSFHHLDKCYYTNTKRFTWQKIIDNEEKYFWVIG